MQQNRSKVERADEEGIDGGDKLHNGTGASMQRLRTRESIFDGDFNNVYDSIDSDEAAGRAQDQILRNRCDLESFNL